MAKLAGTLIIALLAMAVWAPAAPAKSSAIDEYVEHVPGGGGEKPSGDFKKGGGKSGGGKSGGGSKLDPGIRGELEALGADGEAAASLAEAGSAASATGGGDDGDDQQGAGAKGDGRGGGGTGGGRGGGGTGGVGAGSDALTGAGDTPKSGASALVSELAGSDSDGLGIALPLILIGAFLIAGIAVLAKRRHGTAA